MFSTLKNAFRVREIRSKIIYTLVIVIIFRRGCHVMVPFLNPDAVQAAAASSSGTLSTYLGLLTGGAFQNATLFAMSITPFINASIIMQLLTVAIPALERLSKDEENGRKRIAQITRYVAVTLGLLQGFVYYITLTRNTATLEDGSTQAVLATNTPFGGGDWFRAIVIIACFVAGTALVMWLGEQINEKGIGNGISMILFAGILANFKSLVLYLVDLYRNSEWILATAIILGILFMIVYVVVISATERRIAVQYAKRVVGRKVYGGQSTHIPFKLNMSGVMSIIFASSLVSMPQMITEFFADQSQGWIVFIQTWFGPRSWVYAVVFFLLIIFFNFFYISISYDPQEIANNLRKNSGSIPGIRPGEPTVQYIKKILNKITLIGAFAVALIAIIPVLVGILFPQVGNLGIGGTTLLICVGVALDTMEAIESQLMMRHYKGFLE